MSHNGWSNRSTWLVNVWFAPESVEDVESIRSHFEDTVDKLPDWMRDFVDTDVDWNELIEHFTEETEDEYV